MIKKKTSRLYHFHVFLFLITALSTNCYSQCDINVSLTQISPSPGSTISSGQLIKLRAEIPFTGSFLSGEFRWYTSETDPVPVYTKFISGSTNYSEYSFY